MTASHIRVIDLETAGNGPYDVCEIGWQDVVHADDGSWALSDEHGALFVNPGRPISPETMAVHHIIDEYVADAPLWKLIAPEVLQPQGGIAALAAHRAAFEQRYCPLVCRVALHGSAPGNARSGFGRICKASRTRCCATSACRWGWCMKPGSQHIARSPMRMSLLITCEIC